MAYVEAACPGGAGVGTQTGRSGTRYLEPDVPVPEAAAEVVVVHEDVHERVGDHTAAPEDHAVVDPRPRHGKHDRVVVPANHTQYTACMGVFRRRGQVCVTAGPLRQVATYVCFGWLHLSFPNME